MRSPSQIQFSTRISFTQNKTVRYAPYFFIQAPNVLYAYSSGITLAFPMIGSEGGLGGKGSFVRDWDCGEDEGD